MNCDLVTTCGENMSLQNVLKSFAKRYYARVKKERRALSLKNVIISCVDLTLSCPQKFSHYYLQYLVLRPSNVMTKFFPMFGSFLHPNFRTFMNKVGLLTILSLLCLTGSAICDQDNVQKYSSSRRMENLSNYPLNSSITINVIVKFIQCLNFHKSLFVFS